MTDTIAPVAGKRYVTRSGWITPVMKPHERGVQCRWIGSLMPSSKIWWGEDGRNFATLVGNESFDLVAEYIEPIPEQPGNTPDADGWIPWHGGECPVGGNTRVEVRFRLHPSKVEKPCAASDLWWSHSRYDVGGGGDIIAYRISKDAATSAPVPERHVILAVPNRRG